MNLLKINIRRECERERERERERGREREKGCLSYVSLLFFFGVLTKY